MSTGGSGTGTETDRRCKTAVVILVPFRVERLQNREAHLTEFLHRMAIGTGAWAIIIVEQDADGQKFSRGRCLNAASRIAVTRYPGAILLLHDVDLIPDVERARGYAIPPPKDGVVAFNTDSVKYVACGLYIGGICSISQDTYMAINGFQNSFQGWGGEDDCFRDAVRRHNPGKDWMRAYTLGSVVDLEDSDPAGCKRACDVPEFKCEKPTRLQNRRIAFESGFSDGVNELVFAVSHVRHFPDISHEICLLTCNLFVQLLPGWRMAISTTRYVPYYYRLLTAKSRNVLLTVTSQRMFLDIGGSPH